MCLNRAEQALHWLSSPGHTVVVEDEQAKVLIFARGGCVFAFNFHPVAGYEAFRVNVPSDPEILRVDPRLFVALDTGEARFGGTGERAGGSSAARAFEERAFEISRREEVAPPVEDVPAPAQDPDKEVLPPLAEAPPKEEACEPFQRALPPAEKALPVEEAPKAEKAPPAEEAPPAEDGSLVGEVPQVEDAPALVPTAPHPAAEKVKPKLVRPISQQHGSSSAWACLPGVTAWLSPRTSKEVAAAGRASIEPRQEEECAFEISWRGEVALNLPPRTALVLAPKSCLHALSGDILFQLPTADAFVKVLTEEGSKCP